MLAGSADSVRLANLHEADHNLALAASDESGGAHNFDYLQILLNDAIARSDIATGVKEQQGQKPLTFALSQNYPNPFNSTTTVEYSLAERNDVTIDIFNVLGQPVRLLTLGGKAAGSYRTEWNGTDDNGKSPSTGVYFHRIHAWTFVKTRKMLLLE